MHDASQSHLFRKRHKKLEAGPLSEGDMNNIVEVLKLEALSLACNTDT